MIKRSQDPQKCRSEIGSMKEVADKNQYPEILPFDYNRVILSRSPLDPYSHYINASYVNVGSQNLPRHIMVFQSWFRERAYVVSQAVKTKAANIDFWRMVWELRSNCIVMLTKVFDFMRVLFFSL